MTDSEKEYPKPSSAASGGPPVPPKKTAIGAADYPEGKKIYLGDTASARELAVKLQRKPFRLIADAMELGEFHSMDTSMDFIIAEKIARKHGFEAIRIRKNEDGA